MAILPQPDHILAPTGAEGLIYYPLRELRELTIEPPKDVVEGVIAEGETVLLVGRPKVGKSRLTLQLALNLSAGEPFLGHRIPRPRKVLIVDLENRPAVACTRIKKMTPYRNSDENITLYAPETLSTSLIGIDGDGLRWFQELINKISPDVIVIDTWRLLIGAKDENKSDVVVEALKQLAQLREKRPQLVIMIVHHLRKQNTNEGAMSLRVDPYGWVENVSGHHALVSHVDACYGIEREFDKDSGDELIVFGGVARNAATTCTLLEEDEETLLFRAVSGDEALNTILTMAERKIVATARTREKFSFTELCKIAQTTNKKAVSSALRKAESQAVVKKEGVLYVWVGSKP